MRRVADRSSQNNEIQVLLSEFQKQIAAAPEDALMGSVCLASPDANKQDGIDVYIAGILRADIDRDKNEILLIPRSSSDDSDDVPFFFLSSLVEELPSDPLLYGDFEIFAELPLDRDSTSHVTKTKTKVHAFHMGPTSGESWFLVRPPAEYARDVLPE